MTDHLAHYGILGMRWGVRRFQNYDGSLTAEGRARQKQNYKNLEKEVNDRYKSLDKTKIRAADEKFNTLGNELSRDYDNYYKSIANNKQLKKEFESDVYSKMYKDFGDDLDGDTFDLLKYDYTSQAISKMEPKKLSSKVEEFYKAGDEYFDQCKAATADIVEKYKDVEVEGAKSKFTKDVATIANSMFMDNEKGSSWNAYMYRHFDDYWVYDVQSRYDLEESITIDGYDKYIAKRNSKG